MAAILSGGSGGAAGGARAAKWLLVALLLLWLAVTLPLALGRRTLFLRDVFTTHLAAKAFGARELAEGRIPAFDPTRGLGEPFRGNPNNLPFYPGNLLYLLLPFWIAFNLHYALHWLLAFLAMLVLAREMGQSREAALLAAVTYAGSGYVLTTMTFYNLLAVVAWWPLVMWGAVRGGRRGLAWGAAACGLALLGGEPLTAAIGVAPLVIAACERHGFARGVRNAFLIGAGGLLVALPQIVATARVWGFTKRGTEGLTPEQISTHALHPLRLLELLLPLPWGWPTDLGASGYFSDRVTPVLPYVYSIHFGIVGLALALVAARWRRVWAATAASALFLAWAGGLSGRLLRTLTGGVFRYPTKLLLVFTLAAALLAGFGLDAALERGNRVARGLRAAAALLAAAALALFLARGPLLPALVGGLRIPLVPWAAHALASWAIGLFFAALVLAVSAAVLARGAAPARGAALAALQTVALVPLFPLLSTEAVSRYAAPPPWAASLGDARSVVAASEVFPRWQPTARVDAAHTSVAEQTRLARLDLESSLGRLYGLTYPLAPDLEGMYSPLLASLDYGLARLDESARVRWLRLLGVDWLVRREGGPVPGLERVAAAPRGLETSELDRVEDPRPFLFWPARIAVAANPLAAFAALSRSDSPGDVTIASRPLEHHAGARLALVAGGPDRVAFDVDGSGGLAVVLRAYQPLYRARLENGTPLATQPADLVLLGVEVPPGRHRVTVDVDARPEEIALAAGALALAAALAAGARP